MKSIPKPKPPRVTFSILADGEEVVSVSGPAADTEKLTETVIQLCRKVSELRADRKVIDI